MAGAEATSTDVVSSVLVRLRMIAPDQAEIARELDKASGGGSFAAAMVASEMITGDALIEALSRFNTENAFDVDGFPLVPRVLNLIPENDAFRLKILPVYQDDKVLFAAVPTRWNQSEAAETIGRRIGLHIEPVPVQYADVQGLIAKSHSILRQRSRRQRRIGQALVERGLITTEQLDMALKLQRQKSVRIGQALTELGFISGQIFFQILAERLKLPLRDSDHIIHHLQQEIPGRITQAFAVHNMILPYAMVDGTLKVATSFPVDINVIETLMSLTGAGKINFELVEESSLTSVIQAIYSGKALPKPKKPAKASASGSAADQGITGARAMADSNSMDNLDLEVAVEDITEGPQFDQDVDIDPEVPRIINYLVYQAVKKGASDIHIEAYEDRADVKFRIDGQMRSIDMPVNRENVSRVISKLKIDAQLDIAERRKPQDGSFRKRFGEKLLVDFRLATQPTLYGENAVIRILDRTSPLPTIPQLGMPERMMKRYLRQIQSPQGMVIFTGPTGSGKTTTLYCTLEVLRKKSMKIITAEDPVEYQFDGIQQCQVNEKIGNTFSKYLRGFLRQDPDVILIGETRDEDTAINAVRAAITGHLVFSTIHASDAIGVVRRYCDMGVDANMLSMSLVSVVYQRLARRICLNCKEPFEPDAEELEELMLDEVFDGATLYKGRGCDTCDGSGYRGRIAVYEMWEASDAERDQIAKQVDERVLRQTAYKNGLKPMVVDAVKKVKDGTTTLEELQEVIPYNQILRAKDFVR